MVSLLLPALSQHQVEHVHSWHGVFDGGDEAKTRHVVVIDPVHCHHGQVLALVIGAGKIGQLRLRAGYNSDWEKEVKRPHDPFRTLLNNCPES